MKEAVESLSKLEYAMPENLKAVKCEKCGKEFIASIVYTGKLIGFPECENAVRV